MVITLLAIGAILIIAEIFTAGVLLVFLGFGFLSASATLYFTDNLVLALIVGTIVALVTTFLLRNPIIKHLDTPSSNSGSDAYIGKKGKVTKTITPEVMGEVVIPGVVWNATSTDTINEGSIVIVEKLVGSHLEVKGE